MERYVLFDDLNTYTDFGFILTEKTINPPEPKTNYVEIEGADGAIDLTEALTGEVRYRNRSVMFTFWTNEGSYHDRVDIVKLFRYKVHGRKMKIVDPDDSSAYLMGRVIITEETHSLAYSTVSMECICDPFIYSTIYTEKTINIDVYPDPTAYYTVVNNGMKNVIPTIEITGLKDNHLTQAQTLTLFYDCLYDDPLDPTFLKGTSLTNGTHKISDFQLNRGENWIGFDSPAGATITIKWLEVSI